MSLHRQITIWLAAFLIVILCLYLFRGILLPFVAGMALAYLLDPLADLFERWGMSRLWATITVLLLFVLIFFFLLVLVVPLLVHQMVGFAQNFPDYIASLQDLFTRISAKYFPQSLKGADGTGMNTSLRDLMAQGASFIGKIVQSLWNGGQALVDLLSLILITPVVAIYLLYDWDRMVQMIDSWLPRDHQMTIRHLAKQIDSSISGFVRGQIAVCLILGVFYAISLSILGLNFGLLIGLGAGIIGFIPYVGASVGLIVSGGVAIVQYWPDPFPILIALAIFGIGQFLEGNILQPRLVGERVGLHPVWLIFALLAFGSFFGIVGMLIAVPVAAAIGVLVRFGLEQYLNSSLYLGRSGRVSEVNSDPVSGEATCAGGD